MLTLAEPPRTPYDLNFSVLGIPVRVHPMFWLFTVIFGLGGGDQSPTSILLWVVAVFVSILVHEFGHALTARAFGHHPWITLHSFGGLASYPHSRSAPQQSIAITAAGPSAGFLLAAAILGLLAASGRTVIIGFGGPLGVHWAYGPPPQSENLQLFIHDMLFINIFWGVVNLVPVLPLDGGQIARELFTIAAPASAMRNALLLSMLAGGATAIYALQRLESPYLAVLFGLMAFASYQTYSQLYGGRWR